MDKPIRSGRYGKSVITLKHDPKMYIRSPQRMCFRGLASAMSVILDVHDKVDVLSRMGPRPFALTRFRGGVDDCG